MVESSDKMWSTGEGKGKPLQYSCLENLMNSQLVSQFSHLIVSDFQPHGLKTSDLPVHHQLPEFTQTHDHGVGDAIQPLIRCEPLLPQPSIFPSTRVFSNESALCIRWPKDWSFTFNISPFNEHSGLVPLEWTVWISLQSNRLSRVSSTP